MPLRDIDEYIQDYNDVRAAHTEYEDMMRPFIRAFKELRDELILARALLLRIAGLHRSSSISYISGTGVAGVNNTAMTVKTLVLPANTLTQVGDRLRVRIYWSGDTGSPITGSCKVGPAGAEVLVSNTTDTGTTTMQLNELWLHYVSNTRANIIEDEAGKLGALSLPNVAGFNWSLPQNIVFTQNAVTNNRTILYAMIVDVMPKGV